MHGWFLKLCGKILLALFINSTCCSASVQDNASISNVSCNLENTQTITQLNVPAVFSRIQESDKQVPIDTCAPIPTFLFHSVAKKRILQNVQPIHLYRLLFFLLLISFIPLRCKKTDSSKRSAYPFISSFVFSPPNKSHLCTDRLLSSILAWLMSTD
ncbi:hypothetical protein CSKR_202232 [Clonorchis sinensis]|uniref:Uncharacterized protein n=1 Tax=Clonorchis sinensis TaxID=79923 RepID=A0A8T1LY76_CLOSI|nr:hypothetical protein CSKR_202232 [Clonorchis sinensis]